MNEVLIVDALRTPIGKRGGSLAQMHSNTLLGHVFTRLVERSFLTGEEIGHVVAGCVSQVGMQSSNIARNAWLSAGLPVSTPAATVTIQCGSSQEAALFGHGLVGSGLADPVIVGGVENMSAIPMTSPVPPDGSLGHPRGGQYAELWEVTSQFEAADRIAEHWGISRTELDAFGVASQLKAAEAWKAGRFSSQVVPIDYTLSEGDSVHTGLLSRDEGLRETSVEKLATLRLNQPDRDPVGLHTAATSSQISDGAAALLLASRPRADELGLRPRARIIDSVLVGSDPVMMLTGPIPATREILARNSLSISDVDVIEINEAFASVVLAWCREFEVSPESVNVNGGAIAMGHPMGATGAVLMTKALHELERTQGRIGLVTMCCGGGLGTATLIERLP